MPYRHYLRDEGFVYHNGCPTDIIFLKEIKLIAFINNITIYTLYFLAFYKCSIYIFTSSLEQKKEFMQVVIDGKIKIA